MLSRLKFRLALANSVEPAVTGYGWRRVAWKAVWNRWASLVGLLGGGAAGTGGFFAVESILNAPAGAATSAGGAVAAALVAYIGGAVTLAKGWIRQPFSFDLNGVVAATGEQPQPVDQTAAAADIEQLIKLLAPTKDEALVVFVDDLDRCSPDKVKDAVEAINLLFNLHGSPGGGAPRTVFVLGMDTDMVAASMRVAYSDMVAELKERESHAARDFGHRFLSKIVQLSFNIPEPQGPALESFLDGLIGPPRDPDTRRQRDRPLRQPISPERRNELRQRLRAVAAQTRTSTERLESVERVVRDAPAQEREEVAEMALDFARRENLRALRGDSAEVQDAIRDGARFLPRRPRDYKRFVNAVRLQLLVANQSLKLEQSRLRASNLQIAKWTALGMHWPVLGELEQWATNGLDPETPWPGMISELMADGAFKKALADQPKLGTVDLHGLISVQ